jgi:hypothetical protein
MPIEFTAVLKPVQGMEAMYVDFPYDVQEMFGTRGWVKVKASFDGVPYRGSLSNMGGDCHILIVRKDVRRQIGKNPGDEVLVTVELDTEERVVEVPEDLAGALAANPGAQEFFETLSYTNRKEYAEWVRNAKRPETRTKRVGESIIKLKEGRKNPSAR